jgi:hypothetical protein
MIIIIIIPIIIIIIPIITIIPTHPSSHLPILTTSLIISTSNPMRFLVSNTNSLIACLLDDNTVARFMVVSQHDVVSYAPFSGGIPDTSLFGEIMIIIIIIIIIIMITIKLVVTHKQLTSTIPFSIP